MNATLDLPSYGTTRRLLLCLPSSHSPPGSSLGCTGQEAPPMSASSKQGTAEAATFCNVSMPTNHLQQALLGLGEEVKRHHP
eukprot:1143538-Pelagomonas_calceolata.AAC.1